MPTYHQAASSKIGIVTAFLQPLPRVQQPAAHQVLVGDWHIFLAQHLGRFRVVRHLLPRPGHVLPLLPCEAPEALAEPFATSRIGTIRPCAPGWACLAPAAGRWFA